MQTLTGFTECLNAVKLYLLRVGHECAYRDARSAATTSDRRRAARAGSTRFSAPVYIHLSWCSFAFDQIALPVAWPAAFSQNLDGKLSAKREWRRFWRKKRRHERSSCSCREASDANHFQPRWQQTRPPPQLEYIHHSIDSEESKYNNRNFLNLIGQQFPKTAQSLNKAVAWRI
jgi:hypothetical protein